jgi:hypothetical protein
VTAIREAADRRRVMEVIELESSIMATAEQFFQYKIKTFWFCIEEWRTDWFRTSEKERMG